MNRKRALIGFAVVLFLASVRVAPAQDGKDRNGEKRVSESTEPLPVNKLKEALSCTDEQIKKFEEIEQALEGAKKQAWTEFNEGEKKADEDREKALKKAHEDRDEAQKALQRTLHDTIAGSVQTSRDKVRAILTDEQKEKYDALIKAEERRQFTGRFGGRRNLVARGGGYTDWEATKAHFYKRADEGLKLTPEEKPSVMALVQKLIEARVTLWKDEDSEPNEPGDLLKKPEDGETRKALAAKLADLRKTRDADRERLERAEKAVREAVKTANEARLVVVGILDP